MRNEFIYKSRFDDRQLRDYKIAIFHAYLDSSSKLLIFSTAQQVPTEQTEGGFSYVVMRRGKGKSFE